MPVNADLLAALLAPVPGDNPAGADLRYDSRYDEIKEARREDADLPQGGLATERKIADWPKVVTAISKLLETQTKDLQLAAWMTEALLKRQGIAGLATGLALLHGMLEQYWETLYPAYEEDDLELRAGPLEWVGAKLDVPVRQVAIDLGGHSWLDYQLSRQVPSEAVAESDYEKKQQRAAALEDGRPAPEPIDKSIGETPKTFYRALLADIAAATTALAALELVADDRFGREAPSFNRLRSAIDDVQRFASSTLAKKLETDPDPVEAVPDAGDGTEAGAADASGAPTAAGTMTAEATSEADVTARVASAARFLRAQDPTNPGPYLMLRGLRWGELRGTPGIVDPTLLEAPPTAVRARLKSLLLQEQWDELLEQGEQLMATPQARGWLDLQRYAIAACTGLGPAYRAVAVAIRSELVTLLAALPGLPDAMLMDDTPVANPETRAWLSALVQGTPQAGAASDGDGTGDHAPDFTAALEAALQGDERPERPAPRPGGRGEDPLARARAELSQQRPSRAVEILLEALAAARSPRDRFLRQTQVATVMVEGGLAPIARPILERLITTIDEHKLEEWEAGPVAAQPLALLHRVLDALGEDDATRQQLYLRICQLDPLQAMALRGTSAP